MTKIFSACVLFGLLLPVAARAAQPSPSATGNKSIPKSRHSTSASKKTAPIARESGKTTPSEASKPAVAAAPMSVPTPAPAPVAAPAAKTGVTLDAYMQALATAVPLSKDELTGIENYYLDDGAKMKSILNDPTLSPLQQTQQVDDLRATRNDTIEALLHDAVRQQNFLRVEADYRVALIVLAADGGMVASAPPASAAHAATAKPAPST